MAAAVRHWNPAPTSVLSALTQRIVDPEEQVCVRIQAVFTLERLSAAEGKIGKSSRTPVQAALVNAIHGLVEHAERGKTTPENPFMSMTLLRAAINALASSGVADPSIGDEFLEIFLDDERFDPGQWRWMRPLFVRFVEERPKAREVWQSILHNVLELQGTRRRPDGADVASQFGCDLQNWDTIVKLSPRGRPDGYDSCLGLSLAECRAKLFDYVEATDSATTHFPIQTKIWKERYRRHPEYASREYRRFCEIAVDKTRTREVREASVQALRGMGGAISWSSDLERVAESKYGSSVTGAILHHDRTAMLDRFLRVTTARDRIGTYSLADYVFSQPPASRDELRVLEPYLKYRFNSGYGKRSEVYSWSGCAPASFDVDARGILEWRLDLLASSPPWIGAAFVDKLSEEDRSTLARRLRSTIKRQPPSRIPLLVQWLSPDEPLEYRYGLRETLSKLLEPRSRNSYLSPTIPHLTALRDRVNAESPNPAPELRAELAGTRRFSSRCSMH